jgi:hypothetical protein
MKRDQQISNDYGILCKGIYKDLSGIDRAEALAALDRLNKMAMTGSKLLDTANIWGDPYAISGEAGAELIEF